MSRTTIQNLSHDETTPARQAEQVKGGLLPAVRSLEVMPTDQTPVESISINFTKIEYRYTPHDDK